MPHGPHTEHKSVSPEIARQVDKICDRFEADWKGGWRPHIEDFICDLGEPERTLLLRDLVSVEFAYRRKNGESPNLDRYLARFPEHDEIIRAMFREPVLDKPQAMESAATRAMSVEMSETRGADAALAECRTSSVGQRLGRFELTEEVGQGAFGTVYRARDPKLERDVALKIPRLGVVAERKDTERFLREARAAAQLRHPHIVAVYEAGMADEECYIASAFIEGITLRNTTKDGRRFTHRETAKLVAQLASALHYAHTQGVIHRDVKPANIMLDTLGNAHVMDFGLARRTEGDAHRTRAGTRLGTPAYMSPEQAQGQSHVADGRTDIWSLGVILYELLAGRRPFEGSESDVLIAIRVSEPVPLRKIAGSIPKDLESVCLKCLAKDRKDRYATAQRLADELERWLRGEGVQVRPIGWTERWWRWTKRHPVEGVLTGSLAGLILVTAVGGMIASGHLSRSRSQISSALAQAEQQTRAAEAQKGRAQESLQKAESEVAARRNKQGAREQAEQDHARELIDRREAQKRADDAKKTRTKAEENAQQQEQERTRAQADQLAAAESTGHAMRLKRFADYVDRISRAQDAWRARQTNQMLDLLNAAPEEFRSWEWGYLRNVAKTKLEFSASTIAADMSLASGNSLRCTLAFSSNGEMLALSTPARMRTQLKLFSWKTSAEHFASSALNANGRYRSEEQLAFTPDDKRIISFGHRGWRIWDGKVATLLKELPMNELQLRIASGSNGRPLVITRKGDNIRVRDAQSRDVVSEVPLPQQRAVISPPVLSLNERWLAFRLNGKVHVWETNPGREHAVFDCPSQMMEIGFSPDGNLLGAIHSQVGQKRPGTTLQEKLVVWNLTTGEEVPAVPEHLAWIRDLLPSSMSRDGMRQMLGGSILEMDSGQELLSFGSIAAAAFSRDGKFLAICDSAGVLTVREADFGKEQH